MSDGAEAATPAEGKRIEWVQLTAEQVAEQEARDAQYIAETDECPDCGGYGMVMGWSGPIDCMNGCYQGRVTRESADVLFDTGRSGARRSVPTP